MRPSRRILAKAVFLASLAGVLAAGSAFAQFYDPALTTLGLSTDVARSPRLLGMGGLSLAVPDRNQSLTLWDFAGSPVGAYGTDSSSTIDLWPGSGSADALAYGVDHPVRQNLAGRATDGRFEAFHRDAEGTAWGVAGVVRSLRLDQLASASTEARRTVALPEATPLITGPFPYFGGGKLHYAVRFNFSREHVEDTYLGTVSNAAGEFIALDGTTLTPPSLFDPVQWDVRRVGIGTAWSYPLGRNATLAAGVDVDQNRLLGTNDQKKSSSQVNEKRPVRTFQGTLVGKLAKSLEYGFDDRYWTSSSQQNWVMSVSAGVGTYPLNGRGKLLEREEKGNAFAGQMRWTHGPVVFGGRYWTRAGQVTLTPPDANDRTAFNLFLNRVYQIPTADSLALPDSIVANETKERSFGYGFGASWKLSQRALAGAEYHWGRRAYSQDIAGSGPKPIQWDFRAGLEYQCSPIVTGRIGGGYGWRDADDLTEHNEFKSQMVSLGLGLKPPGASYGVDIGWSMTWSQNDFDDPTGQHGSHQQVLALIHWGL